MQHHATVYVFICNECCTNDYSVREIKLIASGRGGGGGGRLAEKVVTDVLAQVLGFSGVNREVTFVMRKVFGDSLNEKYITFY